MKVLKFSLCSLFSVILLSGCASSYDESNSAMKKIVSIDEEPVTRMSFVPNEINPAAGVEIKLYKDDGTESPDETLEE